MLVLPAPPPELEAAVTADDRTSSRGLIPMVTPWACGVEQAADEDGGPCADMMPELMVELL